MGYPYGEQAIGRKARKGRTHAGQENSTQRAFAPGLERVFDAGNRTGGIANLGPAWLGRPGGVAGGAGGRAARCPGPRAPPMAGACPFDHPAIYPTAKRRLAAAIRARIVCSEALIALSLRPGRSALPFQEQGTICGSRRSVHRGRARILPRAASLQVPEGFVLIRVGHGLAVIQQRNY